MFCGARPDCRAELRLAAALVTAWGAVKVEKVGKTDAVVTAGVVIVEELTTVVVVGTDTEAAGRPDWSIELT